MQHYLILAQSEVTANALGAWRRLLLGKQAGEDDDASSAIIVVKSTDRPLDLYGLDTYQHVVQRLEELANFDNEFSSGRNLVVLVDEIKPSQLDPTHGGRTWDKLIAMLVLTFPEIRWVFGVIGEDGATPDPKGRWSFPRAEHSLATTMRPARCLLFDLFGLRNSIRQQAAAADEANGQQQNLGYLPCRRRIALALDEEPAYAYFHAYAAYRFGFCAAAVLSSKLAADLLGPHDDSTTPFLALEDIYIPFADSDVGMSDLAGKRRNDWPKLEKADHRIFVTTGHQVHQFRYRESNKRYLAQQKRLPEKHVSSTFKPNAGFFDLWRRSGLMRELGRKDGLTRKLHRGVAKFVWPPKETVANLGEHSHSSPGVLLLIAENLLRRGQKLLPNVSSVEDAVRGAVLATDALELLGGRTPTVSIEALRLKHHFEVLAECQFAGVEYHIRLKERLREIRRDVKVVSEWFKRDQRKRAAFNAEMYVLLGVVKALRDYGQFDEEETCRTRIRHLHNTLWMGTSPIRWSLWPILRYLEALLSSFPLFIVILLAWIIGLSGLFQWAASHPTWDRGVFDAVTSFFSMGQPIHPSPPTNPGVDPFKDWWLAFVISVAIVSGFFHLGVFVSHLYTIVARK